MYRLLRKLLQTTFVADQDRQNGGPDLDQYCLNGNTERLKNEEKKQTVHFCFLFIYSIFAKKKSLVKLHIFCRR